LRDPVAVPVTEVSQVGEVRRMVTALAVLLGFDQEATARAAIVVTEAANNLVKHAREGVMFLRALESSESVGIEVLALDKGPGMADLGRCLCDGFSTAGTPGTGLGAIVRLSASTDFYSRPPSGTALLARLWSRAAPVPSLRPQFQAEAVSVPMAGEEVCGDAWAVAVEGERTLLLVADGLGHGPLAGEASRTAVRIFHANSRLGLVDILQAIHRALHSTRGAAVALAELHAVTPIIRFAGVGNISGVILADGTSRSMMSHNGTVGHEARKFQELTYPFPPGALLVMHSDGLLSRWSLEGYPGLTSHNPALVAGVLYRDFQRGRDDVTVLVARAAEGAPP
jgi:anti-sigma regulatory factor (Ser/Thr protein kinase)